MEAEIGGMQPQAKEYQQPLEAGGSKEWILRWDLQKEPVLPTP